jgi:predicted nucleic acid-binding protein
VSALVYDTGALLAAERRNRRLWSLHDEALAGGVVPVVPVVVLAQAWRAGPQAQLSRLLAGCEILPDDESIGRAAGRLCGLASTSDVVDAMVVVTAVSRHGLVVTSDPGDLGRLAEVAGQPVRLHVV